MTSKSVLTIILLTLLFPASSLNAQRRRGQTPARHTAINPAIQKMTREISASNIEAIIRKLVSFHTRHTLSETESETRGIGAA
ncbi:MAG TPA: hypothetical protein VJQ56_05095, partial [Blastocatellia bacterium]|nr:hypothetical protein [Blastocatellia bacterium]